MKSLLFLSILIIVIRSKHRKHKQIIFRNSNKHINGLIEKFRKNDESMNQLKHKMKENEYDMNQKIRRFKKNSNRDPN